MSEGCNEVLPEPSSTWTSPVPSSFLRCSSPPIITADLLCPCSSSSISFLCWGAPGHGTPELNADLHLSQRLETKEGIIFHAAENVTMHCKIPLLLQPPSPLHFPNPPLFLLPKLAPCSSFTHYHLTFLLYCSNSTNHTSFAVPALPVIFPSSKIPLDFFLPLFCWGCTVLFIPPLFLCAAFTLMQLESWSMLWDA